jgi:bromodomain-containing factor 1
MKLKYEEIVKKLFDNPESVMFREPVDWKKWGLIDYPLKIKYPMDLKTVSEKIRDDVYKTTE